MLFLLRMCKYLGQEKKRKGNKKERKYDHFTIKMTRERLMAFDFLAANSGSLAPSCVVLLLLLLLCLSSCEVRFFRKVSMNASLTLTVSISKLNTDKNIFVDSEYSS